MKLGKTTGKQKNFRTTHLLQVFGFWDYPSAQEAKRSWVTAEKSSWQLRSLKGWWSYKAEGWEKNLLTAGQFIQPGNTEAPSSTEDP